LIGIGYIATNLLLEIRHVGSPQYSRSFHDRWLGFRIAMEELKLPVPDPEKYTEAEMPLLSTIQVPNEMMGKRAVEMLFARLEEPQKPFEKTLINESSSYDNPFVKYKRLAAKVLQIPR
jgi:DNA-binding LacI/PurR family transcriptional regulator